MKLLNKTSIYYLLYALPVFAICSASLYYFISSKVIDKLDDSLRKEKMEIQEKLQSGVDINSLKDDEVCFKLISEKSKPSLAEEKIKSEQEAEQSSDEEASAKSSDDHEDAAKSSDDDDDEAGESSGDSAQEKNSEDNEEENDKAELAKEKSLNASKYHYSDTLLYDSLKAEKVPFRALKAIVSNGKNNYEITLLESYAESDDLTAGILLPVLILFIVLLIGFFLINFWISKRLWKPFYKTLEQLEHYKIDETPIKFGETTIKEFSELNSVLSAMAKKIYTDYKSQKQFIENASHEIQTPLAVINTKIELLIQSASLSESDMQLIQSVYNASNRLSALNKVLLLLSKIENHQFKDAVEIDFEILLEKTAAHFEDLILLKNIQIVKKYDSPPAHKMNAILADILIGNLMQNAIRHNINGGTITIHLTEKSCSISNTSAIEISNTDELFQRFKKSGNSTESIGLGLAIVKEICDSSSIKIDYTCIDFTHTIQLSFLPS